MLTALTVAALLTCAPPDRRPHPRPHPQFTTRCEGADWVRRDVRGFELERWAMAPRCTTVRCEDGMWVRRDANGVELARWVNASAASCARPPVQPPADESWRFGLTARR